MGKPTVHTFTKLVDEPFFVEGKDNLRRGSTQVATITSIDATRLEKRTTDSDGNETWATTFEDAQFSSMQILDDGSYAASMIGGVLNADRDADPASGEGYMIVCECTIQFTADFGGGTTGKVFRRPARIAAGAVTAPSS